MLDLLLLGVLQGVFEWIPISSEGILALTSQFLGLGPNPVDLAIFLHAGTTLAVLIYFWRDWIDVLTLKNKGLARFLVISTIVSLFVGFPVYKLVREVAVGLGLMFLMGFSLILTGYLQSRKAKPVLGHDSLAILSGFLQGLAAIPGLSRSGSTIFGLSFGDLSSDQILKYSYMMSVPVIIVADSYLALSSGISSFAWPALVTSFLVGILSLHALIEIVKKVKFSIFAYLFGVLCLIGGIISLL